MYSFLPDEILKEILTPALQVPDDSFAHITGRSPFSNYERSTSAYLLVCKDWLRVATPLLYSVVVLRSKAQIQALEAALQSTPQLGSFIKKLRVESGYCASMLNILQAAKSLTDLCLSFEVYSYDNISATCRGLSLIQPKRLILYDPSRKSLNQKAKQLHDFICEHIPKWTRLTVVVLPNWHRSWTNSSKLEEMADALCLSQTVEHIMAFGDQYMIPDWIDRLGTISTLKKICVAEVPIYRKQTWREHIRKRPRLAELIEILPSPGEELAQEANKDQLTVPEPVNTVVKKDWLHIFPDVVWRNILIFTLRNPELDKMGYFALQDAFGVPDKPKCLPDYKVLLVCKKFKELATPLVYRCLILTQYQFEKLINASSVYPLIEEHTTSFFVKYSSYSSSTAHMLPIVLSHLPNLKRVSCLPYRSILSLSDIFDWQALTMLSQTAGPNVIDLDIHLHRPSQPKSPDILYNFTSLRHLIWSSSARFIFDPATVPRDALSKLEYIGYTSINNTFLSWLTLMDLPNIRRAEFPVMERCEGAVTFLRKHGHKMHHLEVGFLPGVNMFDICPNLKKFVVPGDKPGFGIAEFFSSSSPHPLQELYISTVDVSRGAVKERYKYLGGLDLSSFISLRQVKVRQCYWPTSESEIRNSPWVGWAERLKMNYNIDLVNEEGQNWTPRLRARAEK